MSMGKLLSVCRFALASVLLTATLQTSQAQKPYWRSASEFIFSLGSVDADSMEVDPVLRFSGFFHFQEQLHINFGKTIGMYTGVGVRNVGMINKLNDSIRIKQRAYALAVPLALKIGSLPEGFNIALGGEAEFFFHYKQKVIYDDEKSKKNEWLSDKINLFNPSVFLEVHARQGTYLRMKYYLLDFLVEDKQSVKINGIPVDFRPDSSQLFYVSIGTTLKQPSGRKPKNRVPNTNTAAR